MLLMLFLLMMRIPITMALALPAIIGIVYLKGWTPLMGVIDQVVWVNGQNYTFSTIPMFVLMGDFLFVSGIASELFDTFRAWFGRIRGGMAMATIAASAVFAASSGSSLATTGTMGTITSKEMLKAGYKKTFSAGSIVAGGTLGILIPPSTVMIIYGMLSGASVGKLLVAGILPGILLTILYIITILIVTIVDPASAPKGEKHTWKEKIVSLRSTGWIIVLFIIVIGGMYAGFFSPTEAAGFGAVGAFIMALVRRKLGWKKLIEALAETLKNVGFLFAITLSAFIFNYFLVVTELPSLIVHAIQTAGLPVGFTFILIVIMYFILGCCMDTLSIQIITIPLMLPVLELLHFDVVWFGVIIVIMIEMALITPPVGANCFVLNGVAPEYKLETIFKGAIIYVIPILITVTLLYFFPQIALYLPGKM